MRKFVQFFIICIVIIQTRSQEQEEVEFSCEDDAATECAPYFTEIMDSVVKPQINYLYNFICLVGGKPRPNVTWTKSGENYYVTDAIKRFRKIQLSDDGNYTCQACNKLGCINHTVEMNVDYEKLEFLKSLQNSTAMIGKPFQFECLTNKHASNTVVYWYPHTANRIILSYNDTFSFEFRSDKEYSGIYKINNVTKEDEGWYLCAVPNPDNEADQISSSAYLTVDSGDAPPNSELRMRFSFSLLLNQIIRVLKPRYAWP